MIELFLWLLVFAAACFALGIMFVYVICHLATWREQDERQLMEWMEEKNG